MLHVQVASIIGYTEQSLERTEKLDQKLGIPATPDNTSFQGTESRRSLLQKRKVTGAACCIPKIKIRSM